MNKMFRAAFKLIYTHDGHIVRVMFIFLNAWWLYTILQPLYSGSDGLGSAGASLYVSLIICVVGLIIGFFLILFRENNFLINANYVTTIVLLLTGMVNALRLTPVGADLGAFGVLAGIATLSYFRYNVQHQTSFNALLLKARIDNEQQNRLTNSLDGKV